MTETFRESQSDPILPRGDPAFSFAPGSSASKFEAEPLDPGDVASGSAGVKRKSETGWHALAVALVVAVLFGGLLGKPIWQAQGGPKEKIAQLEAQRRQLQEFRTRPTNPTSPENHHAELAEIEQQLVQLERFIAAPPPFGPLLRVLGEVVNLCGQVYLRLLFLLVLPLLLTSVASGVAQLGQQAAVGRLMAYAFAYYLATSAIAVGVGMILVRSIQPGVGLTGLVPAGEESSSLDRPGLLETLAEVIRGRPDRPGSGLIPSNLFAAAAEMNVVGVLFFAIVMGLALAGMGPRGQPLLELLERANELLLRLIRGVIAWAPVGVFGLLASQIISQGGWEGFMEHLGRLGLFVLTVLLGLALQGILLVGIATLMAGQNPGQFLSRISPALATAFGTSSSAATLPVSLQCTDQLRVNRAVASFVLPVGVTFNMDGTALYEAVAAIFLAQLAGISLELPQLLIIFVTASLAAIGAPGIPNAGLVTLLLVLSAAGIPAEGVGLLFAVDWFLDRCRTMINVLGDLVGATVIQRFFPARASLDSLPRVP